MNIQGKNETLFNSTQANSAQGKLSLNTLLNSSNIPLDIPIIAHFGYLSDCQVKIPVSVRSKDELFFMKNPVKPNPEWKLNLIIRGIDFPEGQIIRLMKTPFGEVDIWESSIKRKAAHSEFADIYEITTPRYAPIQSQRKAPRVFCLVPVQCLIGDSSVAIPATCVDLSEMGLGLKFDNISNIKIGDTCLISFFPPLENLPPLIGKVVRQSNSSIDQSTSVGLFLATEQKDIILKIIDFMLKRQADQSESNLMHNSSIDKSIGANLNLNRSFISDLTKSFSNDLFNLFQNK